jgi:phosphotransferase system  glucose/maltose/N-acetylglucosamine-specific IIC component
MIDMLTMWFWAYVIGVFLAAVITLFAIVVLIRAIMQPQEKAKQEESPLERWKRGG